MLTLFSCVLQAILSKKLESIVVVLVSLQQRCFDNTTMMLYLVMKASLLLNATGLITTIFFVKLSPKTVRKTFFWNFCLKMRYFADFSFSQLFSSLKCQFLVFTADLIASHLQQRCFDCKKSLNLSKIHFFWKIGKKYFVFKNTNNDAFNINIPNWL